MAATAAVALADDIPGVPLPASPVQGYLDNSNGSGVHTNDVYNFSMRVGDRFYAVLNADSSHPDSDYDLQLFAPGPMGVFGTTPLVDVDPYAYNPYPNTLNYTATAAGLYYLNVAIGPTAGVPYSRRRIGRLQRRVDLQEPDHDDPCHPLPRGFGRTSGVSEGVANLRRRRRRDRRCDHPLAELDERQEVEEGHDDHDQRKRRLHLESKGEAVLLLPCRLRGGPPRSSRRRASRFI